MAADVELVLGSAPKAVGLLLAAVDHDPTNGATWNDLAVAYLEGSAVTGAADSQRVAALDAALAAVEFAPEEPEGWFNLWVAARWLSLDTTAQHASHELDRLEGASLWSAEAHRRFSWQTSGLDLWAGVRVRLVDYSREVSGLVPAVARSPQQTEELLLDVVLPDASRAFLAGDSARSDLVLRRARTIAEAVRHVAGDNYLLDCTNHLAAAFGGSAQSVGRTLALAHLALADGRRDFEADEWDRALSEFSDSQTRFAGSGSPCADWLLIQDGVRAFQDGRPAVTLRRGLEVADRARSHGYLSLLARGEWLQATGWTGAGRFDQAVVHYDRAAQLYERTRQAENRLVVRGASADAMRLMGETDEGWSLLLPGLHELSAVERTRRRYQLFLNASLYASSREMLRAALVFHQASLDEAKKRKVVNTIVEGLIRGAALRLKMARVDAAADELRQADELLPSIPSETVRRYQAAWLARIRGEIEAATRPADGVIQLRDVVDFFSTREPAEVPPIYLVIGKAARSAGHPAEAEKNLRAGIAAFQYVWTGLASDQHQVSYLSESWDLFDEMVDLRAAAHDTGEAFRFSEMARSFALDPAGSNSSSRTTTLTEVPIDGRTILVYFACLGDSIHVWQADAHGTHETAVPVGRAALASRVRAFRSMIEAGASAEEVKAVGSSLYDALLTPLGPLPANSTLVLLPDGALPGLPFAALIDPRTGRFLIEETQLMMAPSLTFYDEASRRLTALKGDLSRVVAMGSMNTAGLPRLPSADREIEDVATSYGSRGQAVVSAATPEDFARRAVEADVVHFAGHAKANPVFPWRSALALAPDRTHADGTLTAGEIATWRLPKTKLVVLSACQTAFGGNTREPGLLGLARGFLLAGVPSIVGSLWDVDDRQTYQLMTAFHRSFAGTSNSAAALRSAQLALLHGDDPVGRLPRSWAAFLVVGGIAR